jgi:hypothetical protein
VSEIKFITRYTFINQIQEQIRRIKGLSNYKWFNKTLFFEGDFIRFGKFKKAKRVLLNELIEITR